jgi:cobalt/nickel transport system permease protein
MRVDSTLFEVGGLDDLAGGSSAIHRLDPRAKVVTALAFVVTVVSFGKYEVSALLPLALYPVALMAAAGLPPVPLLKRLMLAAPFVLMVGLFNPLFDRVPVAHVGPVVLSGGVVSFISILIRFVLTVMAALILVATTGFHGVCHGLGELGVPRVFVVQLLFLYRYIFVLTDEAAHMVRAHAARAVGTRGLSMHTFGTLSGQLLLRALSRAERVHAAMSCRGFDGRVRLARRLRIGAPEAAFVLGWGAFFLLARLCNLSQLLGRAALEVMR